MKESLVISAALELLLFALALRVDQRALGCSIPSCRPRNPCIEREQLRSCSGPAAAATASPARIAVAARAGECVDHTNHGTIILATTTATTGHLATEG